MALCIDSKGVTSNYEYDVRNRLTKIEYPDAGKFEKGEKCIEQCEKECLHADTKQKYQNDCTQFYPRFRSNAGR